MKTSPLRKTPPLRRRVPAMHEAAARPSPPCFGDDGERGAALSKTSRVSTGLWLLAVLFLSVPMAPAQNVEFTQTSVPAGVVNQSTYPLPETTVSTVTAPDPATTYRFTHWTLNGVRQAGAGGCAVNPVTFVINQPALAVAHYLPENQDNDGDGLPDWWEIRSFGDLLEDATGPNRNRDNDEFDSAAEFLKGTCPTVHDDYLAGGVSRRRGLVLSFEEPPPPPDPSRTYGGISRRRGLMVQTLGNNDVLLTETSSPAGVLSRTRVVADVSTVALMVPPDPFSGYRFIGWYVNTVRKDSPTSSHPVSITVNGNTTVEARYLSATVDNDTPPDGLADWFEWRYFNNLDENLTSDPDNDGFPIDEELFRGYSAVAPNDPAAGGVSRRRSAVFTADTTGRLTWTTNSDPATILSDVQWLPTDTVVNVPDRTGHIFAGYRFAYWSLDGTRVEDASGAALGRFSFTLTANSTTTGHYFPATADSDSDGIPDWHEQSYYGNTDEDGASDTDGDDWTYAEEYYRGYSPRAHNDLAAGGVSRRRSLLTAVNAVFLPNPPAIGVNAARNITQTTATLSAVVNPIGSPTRLQFEYGLTNTYGSPAPAAPGIDAGDGLSAVTVETSITDLLPGTIYHFRAVANNAEGTTWGRDYVFRTQFEDFGDAYGIWAAPYGGVGDRTEDDDNDGILNGLEFAFATDPKVFTPNPVTATRVGDTWVFVYHRSRAAMSAGVQFIPEWNDTLGGGWRTDGLMETVEWDNGTVQEVKITFPAGIVPRRFVRLRVELP